jgi:hypothetical protein
MEKFLSFDSNQRIKKKVAPLISEACVMNWVAKWAGMWAGLKKGLQLF